MTIRFILIIGLIIISSNSKSLACDCNPEGPFLKVASKIKLVSLVKISKYLTFHNIYGNKTPMSMEVEIIEIYKGAENRKKITVWGDPGNLCRPYLSTFKEGQYYLVALYSGSPSHGQDNEKSTDYSISNCGEYWLNIDIKKQIALGNIDNNGHQSIKLALIKSSFDQNDH